jgi:uncharacterized membrane protein (DUF2068 family)
MDKRGGGLVVLIGIFKLVKATLLIGLGLGGLLGMQRDMAHGVARAIAWIGTFPGRHTLARAVGRLWSLDPRTSHELGALALCYASVFVVEGIGLLRKKEWAEWLTVAVTASFIPFEIYELVEQFGAGRIVALLLNVAIVVYLAARRIRERGHGHGRLAAIAKWRLHL